MNMSENVFDVLTQRGFVEATSDEGGVRALLADPGATFYCGFDPSASSFHLGNLLVIMAMTHLQRAGHQAIFLLGGATGLIGDPTGKTKARQRLTAEIVSANARALKAQVEGMGLLQFEGEGAAVMVNNFDWIGELRFLEDFMAKIAPSFSVNEMVRMATFAERLAKEEHLSLFEFCYPAMQAYDFLWLFENHGCRLQVGGSDQWGNILQGTNLVRRKLGKAVFALTFPLLTDSEGRKMGKTEEGPVWLDPEKTSPFDFFQYLQGVPDEMVPKLLKLYTFLPLETVEKIAKGDPRQAQLQLAFEVTKIVHGEEAAQEAKKDFDRLAGRAGGATESVPTFALPKEGLTLDELLTQAKALPSKGEVRRRCTGGGIRIDGEKVADHKALIDKPCTIRYGKGKFLQIVLSNVS